MAIKEGQVGPIPNHVYNVVSPLVVVNGKLIVQTGGFTYEFQSSDVSKAAGPTGGKVPADQPSPFPPAPDAGEGEQGGNKG